MGDKNKDKEQESPRSVRLWAENELWLDGMATMYDNFNAALNIAVMKARGCGDYEIEQACQKHMRRRK